MSQFSDEDFETYLKNARTSTIDTDTLKSYADAKGVALTDVIDYLFERTSFGKVNHSIGQTFMGFNHRNTPLPIPINRDTNGLVFFTRPDLNLSNTNIRSYRKMNALRNTDPSSLGRIIRCTLDPNLLKGRSEDDVDKNMTCPVIDNDQVFIPMMTNTCISVSGFEDIELPATATKPGPYGESMMIADGILDKLGTYDITTTFRNMSGSPILHLLYYWSVYASAVRQGLMRPRQNNILEHRIDYQTAIYRVILDHSHRFVENIARTGFSQPKYIPFGAVYNYEHDKPFNQANEQISITWTGHGLYYQDDLLIRTFNMSVAAMNEDLGIPANRAARYVKVPYEELMAFNHRGYPRINPSTREMEWWVKREEYDMMTRDIILDSIPIEPKRSN